MIDITLFFLIYLALGLLCVGLLSQVVKLTHTETQVAFLAVLFRAALTWYYWHYTLSHSADAMSYYFHAQHVPFHWADLFSTSTAFVDAFTAMLYPLTRSFHNGYLMMYIPYSLTALAGSCMLYLVLRQYVVSKKTRRMALIGAFFLPNLIFWTSNLGKDSIAFFGITAVVYAVLAAPTLRIRVAAAVVGGVALYAVRPHVFLFLVAALGGGWFLQRRALSAKTVIPAVLAFVAFIALFDNVMDFAGINVAPDEERGALGTVGAYYESGMDRIEYGSQRLATGGAAMEREGVNELYAPLYFLQFLLGPFLWQARKPIQVVSALENIIYQLMLIYLVFNWRSLVKAPFLPFKLAWLIYLVVASTLLGMMYSNFGLTVRQKCMVLPVLVVFFMAAYGYKEKLRLDKKAKRKAVRDAASGGFAG